MYKIFLRNHALKVGYRGKYFYKKVKIIPSKFCNNAKFFPRPKDPKVQKSSNVEKVFTENI